MRNVAITPAESFSFILNLLGALTILKIPSLFLPLNSLSFFVFFSVRRYVDTLVCFVIFKSFHFTTIFFAVFPLDTIIAYSILCKLDVHGTVSLDSYPLLKF